METTIKETGRIKQFACGGSFTVALTDQGNIYSWGYAEFVKKNIINYFIEMNFIFLINLGTIGNKRK